MEEVIAKRYVTALWESVDESKVEEIAAIFADLAVSFENPRFKQILIAPDMSRADKTALLLDAVKSVQSKPLDNLIRLLVEKGRVEIIPAMAEEFRLTIARRNKTYSGVVYSNNVIDAATLKGLSAGLGKKVDASITLESVKTDFDGIKLEVEDLGIEINFSKCRTNMQLVEHILKAI